MCIYTYVCRSKHAHTRRYVYMYIYIYIYNLYIYIYTIIDPYTYANKFQDLHAAEHFVYSILFCDSFRTCLNSKDSWALVKCHQTWRHLSRTTSCLTALRGALHQDICGKSGVDVVNESSAKLQSVATILGGTYHWLVVSNIFYFP